MAGGGAPLWGALTVGLQAVEVACHLAVDAQLPTAAAVLHGASPPGLEVAGLVAAAGLPLLTRPVRRHALARWRAAGASPEGGGVELASRAAKSACPILGQGAVMALGLGGPSTLGLALGLALSWTQLPGGRPLGPASATSGKSVDAAAGRRRCLGWAAGHLEKWSPAALGLAGACVDATTGATFAASLVAALSAGAEGLDLARPVGDLRALSPALATYLRARRIA